MGDCLAKGMLFFILFQKPSKPILYTRGCGWAHNDNGLFLRPRVGLGEGLKNTILLLLLFLSLFSFFLIS